MRSGCLSLILWDDFSPHTYNRAKPRKVDQYTVSEWLLRFTYPTLITPPKSGVSQSWRLDVSVFKQTRNYVCSWLGCSQMCCPDAMFWVSLVEPTRCEQRYPAGTIGSDVYCLPLPAVCVIQSGIKLKSAEASFKYFGLLNLQRLLSSTLGCTKSMYHV